MVRPPKSTFSFTYTFFALDIVLSGVVDLRVILHAAILNGSRLVITNKASLYIEWGIIEKGITLDRRRNKFLVLHVKASLPRDTTLSRARESDLSSNKT